MGLDPRIYWGLLLEILAISPAYGKGVPDKEPVDQSAEPYPISWPTWWVTFADYPKSELDAGKVGLTTVAVSVGINGLVQTCRLVKSSGSSVLDSETCRLITKRGKFFPAKNKDGNTIDGLYFIDIDWRFDRTPAAAVVKGNPANWVTINDYPAKAVKERRFGVTSYSLTINHIGRVASCSIVVSSGHSDLDEAACSSISRRARFTPARDRMGVPVFDNYTSAVNWVMPIQEPVKASDDPILTKASARCIHLGFKLDSKGYRKCVAQQLVLLAK